MSCISTQVPDKSTKSGLYRIQAQESAVEAVKDALTNFQDGFFQPRVLSYQDSDVKGNITVTLPYFLKFATSL